MSVSGHTSSQKGIECHWAITWETLDAWIMGVRGQWCVAHAHWSAEAIKMCFYSVCLCNTRCADYSCSVTTKCCQTKPNNSNAWLCLGPLCWNHKPNIPAGFWKLFCSIQMLFLFFDGYSGVKMPLHTLTPPPPWHPVRDSSPPCGDLCYWRVIEACRALMSAG